MIIRRAHLVACLCLASAFVAPRTYGQDLSGEPPGFWVTPAARTALVHEDNLLFTGENRSVGTFVRITPTMTARYRSPLHAVDLGYGFDAELHPGRYQTLDNAFARQAATGAFQSRVTPRSLIAGRARYLTSLRPEDAVEDTGLGFEFKRTMAFAGGGSFDRDFTPRLRGRIAYDVSHEDFGEPSDTRPSARSTLHTGSTQLAMLVAPRTRLGVDYMMRRLLGDDLRLRTIIHGEFTAHVLAARLTREVTPSLTVVLMAGPRVSQSLPTSISGPGTTALRSTIEPEALASLTYRRGDQRLSAAYTRSQFIGYGASGFVDTESIDVRAATVLANRVELSARPAIFRNSLLDVTARAYRVDAGVAVRVSRWLNIDGTYVHRYQDRTLTLADALSPGEAKARTRRSLMVGVSIRRSMRLQKSPGRDDDRPNVRNVP